MKCCKGQGLKAAAVYHETLGLSDSGWDEVQKSALPYCAIRKFKERRIQPGFKAWPAVIVAGNHHTSPPQAALLSWHMQGVTDHRNTHAPLLAT